MAIIRIDAPAEVDRLVERAINSLGSFGGALGLGIGDDGSGPSASEAIPLHGYDVVDGGATFPQFGWRSFIADDSGAIVAVDIAEGPHGVSAHRVFAGAILERLMAVADDAEESGEGGDYTLRLVDLPSIKLAALWLENPEKSLFLPYSLMEGVEGKVLEKPGFMELIEEFTPPPEVQAEFASEATARAVEEGGAAFREEADSGEQRDTGSGIDSDGEGLAEN